MKSDIRAAVGVGHQLELFGPPPPTATVLRLADVMDPDYELALQRQMDGGLAVLATVWDRHNQPDTPREVIGIDLDADQVVELVEFLRRKRRLEEPDR